MFGIGWTEAIFIAIILLVFVGPKHLPGMLRKLGRLVAELRKASRELQNQLDLETRGIEPPGRIVDDLKRGALDIVQSPYEEARKLDQDLKQSLSEATRVDAIEPPREPGDPEQRSPADGESP